MHRITEGATGGTVPGPGAGRVLAALLVTAAVPCSALEVLTFESASLAGEGWSSGPVTARVSLGPDDRIELEASARDLSLPPPLAGIRDAVVRCPDARHDASGTSCADAVLELQPRSGDPVRLHAEVRLDAASGALELRAEDQPLGRGRVDLQVDLAPAGTRLDARVRGLDLVAAAALAGGLLPVRFSAGIVDGRAALSLDPRGGAAHAALELRDGAYSDESGLHAGEGLAGRIELEARGGGGDWEITASAAVSAGLVYHDPLLMEVPEQPVTARVEARLDGDGVASISSLVVDDPAGARVEGSGRVAVASPAHVLDLDLEVARVPARRLYRRYLAAFAGAGALAELELRGDVSARLGVRGGVPVNAQLAVEALDLGDAGGRFAVLGLLGEAHWRSEGPVPATRLGWDSAQIGAMDLGAGRLHARLAGRTASLEAPLEVPVLDGLLRIDRLEAHDLGTAGLQVEADVDLAPVSLERLSNRLAWLPLSGSVSGRFPRLVYTDRSLAVNGDVQMRLFDGEVTISGLRLEDPFGVVPRLLADARLRGVDLGVLTRAFSFGSIEGRLDGRVDGLVLEGWRPLAFDAEFATPVDDSSRHRISQRAVDNLASLGGANAVLSSTFLRFFKEFSYDRLGLRCRLRAGVCEMGGVEPASQGYYIVKGGGLPPRVDVVGYNDRVDWPTLLERLKAVASTQGPVIR